MAPSYKDRMRKGFSALILLLVVPVVFGILFLVFSNYSPLGVGESTSLIDTYNQAKSDLADIQKKVGSSVSWEFDQNTKVWQAIGVPPNCPEPFTFPSPIDVTLATSVLYPGQVRGGDYKAHGGFRLDNLSGNDVNVYAPFDGKLVQAARHTQGSEVQYVLYFTNDCGMAYKLDHLLKVTEKFEKIFENVPLAGDNNTRTTQINPPVFTSKGELVATKVGLSGNVFFDFGVYDLRKTNGVNYKGRNIYNVEQYGGHALCWLDYLEESDKSIAKGLPGADGQSGKTSDYCK